MRHVQGDRRRSGLRPRLPDRRRDPRLARGVPVDRPARGGCRLMATLFKRRRSKATQTERVRESRHEGFLRYADFRWAKISGGLCLLVIVSYSLIDVQPRPNGGSWYGYTLGTIGALLILWLTALGYRKRRMTRDYWSLKAWTSAHVYLGLSLIVIGTWHTGFQLGWNVHTQIGRAHV